MRTLYNIEASGIRRGEYIGYGGGLVWRIRREGRQWRALEVKGAWDTVRVLRTRTLDAMSDRLERLVRVDLRRPIQG